MTQTIHAHSRSALVPITATARQACGSDVMSMSSCPPLPPCQGHRFPDHITREFHHTVIIQRGPPLPFPPMSTLPETYGNGYRFLPLQVRVDDGAF